MATETKVQTFVHKLEEGGWAKWIRRALLLAAIAFVIYLWMFNWKGNGFKGLSHEKAIEQAQIAREIARGNGFSSKMIRPAALWLFEQNTGGFPLERTPDIYHAPLNPLINSLPLRLVQKHWDMDTKDVIYVPDQIIVGVQLIFFLLGVLVSYFTARRIFDERLAVLGAGLLLLCQKFWDFALSGLPQNLMFFLFACALHVLFRAYEARAAGKPTWPWLAGCGALFGVLALTHGLTIWIFFGLLLLVPIYFRPRAASTAIIFVAFALVYSPWLVRNAQVVKNPAALGWWSVLYQIRGTESSIMRSMQPPLKDTSPWLFREKIQGTTVEQLNSLYAYLGSILVAPMFFVGLLHLFKRKETADFRWAILMMWLWAVLGMSVFGLESLADFMPFAPPVKANDLHLLFIPMLTFYGLAFVLVLWSRLELNIKIVRFAFIGTIFLISAIPFLIEFVNLNSDPKGRVQWPPYVPPYIAVMTDWTTEREIICSDMPWAVAWYADRKSLWLPMTLKDFNDLNDYNKLKGRLVGLYLTPITGNKPFIQGIVKGEYKEWSAFIMRQPVRDFPLRAVTAMPIDQECVFYSDRDRWTARED